MKIKDGYLMDTIGGQQIAVSVNQSDDKYSGFVKMNEVGAFLWEKLQKECTIEDLVDALTDEYEVSAEQAREDVEKYIATLESKGILE